MTHLFFTCATISLALTAASALADPRREPVVGIPRFGGHDIARFVLRSPLTIDRSKPGVPFANTIMVKMFPGSYVPVSQDSRGVYYQAFDGTVPIRSGSSDGGFYVSKSDRRDVRVYTGDANVGSKDTIEIDNVRISQEVFEKLHAR